MKSCVYLDEAGEDELEGFSVLEVLVERPSRVIGAPVESGSVSFDNKVIDPAIVTVRGVVDKKYGDAGGVLLEIETMYKNRGFEFYSVSDGMDFYAPLILEKAPSKRSTDKFDFATFDLVFKEVLLVQGDSATPSNSENSDTKDTGYTPGN